MVHVALELVNRLFLSMPAASHASARVLFLDKSDQSVNERTVRRTGSVTPSELARNCLKSRVTPRIVFFVRVKYVILFAIVYVANFPIPNLPICFLFALSSTSDVRLLLRPICHK